MTSVPEQIGIERIATGSSANENSRRHREMAAAAKTFHRKSNFLGRVRSGLGTERAGQRAGWATSGLGNERVGQRANGQRANGRTPSAAATAAIFGLPRGSRCAETQHFCANVFYSDTARTRIRWNVVGESYAPIASEARSSRSCHSGIKLRSEPLPR